MAPPRASALAFRSVRIARCTSRWLDETPDENVWPDEAFDRWLREFGLELSPHPLAAPSTPPAGGGPPPLAARTSGV